MTRLVKARLKTPKHLQENLHKEEKNGGSLYHIFLIYATEIPATEFGRGDQHYRTYFTFSALSTSSN